MRRIHIAAVSALLAVLACPDAARADFRLSASVDGSVLFAEYARETNVWEADPGMAANLVLGIGLPTRHVVFVPELSLGWAKFTDSYSRDTLRVLAGLRAAGKGQWQPALFAHAGWGYSEGIDFDAVLQRSGLAFDGGAGVDLRIDPHWALGAQVAYNGMSAATGSGMDVTHWISLGLRVDARW